MIASNPIFLIGMRAAGKSSIGHALATRLKWNFIDTDALIEHTYKCSIAEIVAQEGWPSFRAKEEQILQTCKAKKTIYATGGGIILSQNNRDFMRKQGQVCFLTVPAHIIVQRLSTNAANRPPLTSKGLLAEIETVLDERLPLYKTIASFEVDASLSFDEVIDNILVYLSNNDYE